MKTLVKLTGLLVLFLSACSTSYHSAGVHDDIYYSRSNAEMLAENAHEANATVVQVTPASESQPAAAPNQHYSQEQYYEYQDYEYYVVENDTVYFDDNYDVEVGSDYPHWYHTHYGYDYFGYSSRLRRFHRNYAMFGYYDPWFTNMYWYSFNPHFYGASIYFGYGWPSYYYGWGMGFHPFHPFPSYGWWGAHHFGWHHRPYWHHSPFWGGYGHWGGYGYYGYYPGLYTSTQTYAWGSRRPDGTSTGIGTREPGRYGDAGQTMSQGGRITGGETLKTANDNARPSLSEANPAVKQGGLEAQQPPANELSAAQPQSQAPERQRPDAREGTAQPADYTPQRTPQDFAAPVRPEQAPRYNRPQEVQQQEKETQTAEPGSRVDNLGPAVRPYTPPSQQQPRSNQEYRRPAGEQRPVNTATGSEARPQQNQPQRPQATPQRPVQTRPQAAPQRPTQNRPQATPQRTPQSRPQAAPQRAPQRSPQAAPARSPQRSPAVSNPSRGSSGSSGVRSSSPPSRSSGNTSSGSRSSSSSSNSRSSGRR